MNTPTKRFRLAASPMGKRLLLIIQDYNWWTENEREILAWLADNLPTGQHQDWIIGFHSNKDRAVFLSKWGP